jgi:thiol-disulfide isomerase/thioredoxin
MPTKRQFLLGGACTLAMAAGVGVAWRQSSDSAPDAGPTQLLFSLDSPCANADKSGIASSKVLRGRVLLVNFWATWCAPCIKEMPELNELRRDLQKEFPANRLEFAGIGVDNAQNVQQFIVKTPIDYPLFALGAGGMELAKAFGNDKGLLPFTALLDSKGSIVWQHLGVLNIDQTRGQIRQMM